MSLLLTVAVMYMLNFSINNLTLMALTLAIGFLVDDAIVFLENVVRRAEHGESILKATMNSAGEISFTILSMTLSLAAVFIPLAFMPGLLGRIFREFAITIIVAIMVMADRKSTRLNSSHSQISYAVFCLKKKNKNLWISQGCTLVDR